ncbi:hypothetical protein [Mesorhizobium sp.]|uniref:hypothetical protein n=1 Tax=Mesorhizobium sp. TaxID=1871066 RepID=UPI0025DD4020|nr:hypothetical protein [Mesorhizobium sp.]
MSYFEFLAKYGDRILNGTLVTIVLTILAAVLAIAIAVAAGLCEYRQIRWSVARPLST